MTDLHRRLVLKRSLAAAGLAAVPMLRASADPARTLNDQLSGYVGQLHDPVMIKEGSVYHVFGSGGWNKRKQMSWRTSTDLIQWSDNGDPFPEAPQWAFDAIPGAESMYLGRDGKFMLDGYGTSVVIERPWASTRWRGPGHCGLYRDANRDYIVYHAYDAENKAEPTLRISELIWDRDGWPSIQG